MKIFWMDWKISDISRPAAMFAWIFLTFPFLFLVGIGMWSARETWSFVGFVVYLSLFWLPIVIFSAWRKKWLIVVILASVIFVGTLARAITLPDIRPQAGKKLESVFLDGAAPLRHSPWMFFSERDLIRMGSPVILGFHPQGRNKELSDGIAAKYDAMAKDPDFGTIWSEYVRAFDDMIGIQHTGTHYYRYTPSGGGGERLIVFLHGAMGDFMMYPWMFRELSERSNSTMAYVSFGYGEWGWKWGVEAIKWTIDHELATWRQRHPDAKKDPEITLVALSRGGTGLTRFIARYPGVVRYVAPISAVLEPDVMDSKEFMDSLKRSKLLILHGKLDDNVPVQGAYILEKIARDSGVDMEAIYPENGDHFTMFDHGAEFDAAIEKMWKK